MLQTNAVLRTDGRLQVLVEREARHLGAMSMDRHIFAPARLNRVQVIDRKRIL